MADSSWVAKNPIVRLLVKHWTVKVVEKSPRELERERNLFLVWKGIAFSRWMLFPAAFLIQFCCGSLYSWSNFNIPIDVLLYGTKTANKAPTTFYIATGMFGTTTMLFGPWVERHGPRLGLILGSTAFALGNAITAISLNQKSIIGVYIGYGVLVGFGIGVNYICPVSTLQKYFPDYRGVASGFAVGGFGAGAIVWSKTYLPLIERYKLPWTFGILAVVQSGAMVMASIVLRTPPDDFTAGGVDIRGDKVVESEGTKDVEKSSPAAATAGPNIEINFVKSIFSPDFFFMYLTYYSTQQFGVVVLSRLSNMAQDLFQQTANEGATLVSINGVFNCLGRLMLPMVGDLVIKSFGTNPPLVRKSTYLFVLVTQIGIVTSMHHLMSTRNYDGFRAVIWLLTFTYGGAVGTIPCFLTDMFGPYNIGPLHGVILTAWSIAGVGGGLGFTSVYNGHKPGALPAGQTYPLGAFDQAYESNFTWFTVVLICGIVMLFFVRTDSSDRSRTGWRCSICGLKLFHFRPESAAVDAGEQKAVAANVP